MLFQIGWNWNLHNFDCAKFIIIGNFVAICIFNFTKNSALTISIINLSPISNQILLQHLKATKSDTFWHRAWQVTFTEKCIQKWWEKKIVKRMCDKLGPQFPVHCQTSKCRKYLCEKKKWWCKSISSKLQKKYLKKKWFTFHCGWKLRKFTLTKKIFRQTNYLVISLVKVLLSRNFCQKRVRVNFCNFHTVVWKFGHFPATQNLREINFRSSKNAIYAILETLNFDFLVLFSLHKSKFR